MMLNVQPTEEGVVAAEVTMPHAATQFWSYEGAVLNAGDRWVSPADLLEFARIAQERYPDERVILHEFGLRVTRTAGMSGPRLEWRDWD